MHQIEMQASTSNSQQHILHDEVTGIRRWTALPGRNKYCCDGRIIMSRQVGVFYFTVLLIVGSMALHLAYDAPYLWENVQPLLPILSVAMMLIVLGQLFKTAFSDPGVVPRATEAEKAYEELMSRPQGVDTSDVSQYRPPPRVREVEIRGQLVKLKYCYTCHIFRPPRTSHCSICDNCIMNFDHHCPWVGNCVGLRNYRHFYFFITMLSILCIYVFCCSVLHLVLASTQDEKISFLQAMQKSPGSLIVILISFFSVWSVLGLSVYHTYLLVSAVTTNEDLKGSFNPKRVPNVKNPYSTTFVGNWCATICGPEYPSVLDRRGFVTQKHVVCEPRLGSDAKSAAGLPACTVDRTDSYDAISRVEDGMLRHSTDAHPNGVSHANSGYGSVL